MTDLRRIARFPRLRALAWSGDTLYASRKYELLRTTIVPGKIPSDDHPWETVATYNAPYWRRLTSRANLSSRLVRDGFHALAVLPSNAIVAAVPGAIITLRSNENNFEITHKIARGTRPLHITTTPNGTAYWGEYFDNPSRDEVHIYASTDGSSTWNIAYTFPKGAIRHVHNIIHDPWQNCLWISTGDYGEECRILRASCDLRQVDVVLQGNQQARAVALVPAEDALYFSSDTPLEQNFIYHLDRGGAVTQLAPLTSSSIYGCRVGPDIFFSTMVEPSAANPDRFVRIFGGCEEKSFIPILAWEKDRWPMRFFQYGNAVLPDGENSTQYLALTTVAVKSEDVATSLYAIEP